MLTPGKMILLLIAIKSRDISPSSGSTPSSFNAYYHASSDAVTVNFSADIMQNKKQWPQIQVTSSLPGFVLENHVTCYNSDEQTFLVGGGSVKSFF